METRRRDSKSYLLRRELRQQKGVHCVSGRKATIYTAAIPLLPVNVLIKLLCQPFYLYPSGFLGFFYLYETVQVRILTRSCIFSILFYMSEHSAVPAVKCMWL